LSKKLNIRIILIFFEKTNIFSINYHLTIFGANFEFFKKPLFGILVGLYIYFYTIFLLDDFCMKFENNFIFLEKFI
jgi:hypothetical protein